ncbi:MAG: DUF4124 domain-containing protein [Bermanella sp.]
MKNIIMFVFLLTGAFHSQAGIYKCVIDGKTTFSGEPCSDNAEKVNIQIRKPKKKDVDLVNSRNARISKALNIKRIEGKIEKSEKKVEAFQLSMDRDTKKLELKKSYANNNLAGATWENSISTEIRAVIEKYKFKITSEEDKINAYRTQLEKALAEG